MKEVTSAQGQLRCGECDYVFDAMSSLSSTLPDGTDLDSSVTATPSLAKHDEQQTLGTDQDSFTPDKMRKYFLLGGIFLALLLLMQVLHSFRNTLAHQPLTSGITRAFCKITSCEIKPKRDPSQIELISQNVYAHPNESGSLIISASLKNTAPYEQPLPLIEISFLDKEGKSLALRRFRPESYLPNKENKLFKSNETITFRLKVSDPGVEAIRFKFNFL